MWKLNRLTGRQEYEPTQNPADTVKGEVVEVHFVDALKKRYVGKKACRIIRGSLYPEKGVMMDPGASPVSLHGDKWVHWIGATPR